MSERASCRIQPRRAAVNQPSRRAAKIGVSGRPLSTELSWDHVIAAGWRGSSCLARWAAALIDWFQIGHAPRRTGCSVALYRGRSAVAPWTVAMYFTVVDHFQCRFWRSRRRAVTNADVSGRVLKAGVMSDGSFASIRKCSSLVDFTSPSMAREGITADGRVRSCRRSAPVIAPTGGGRPLARDKIVLDTCSRCFQCQIGEVNRVSVNVKLGAVRRMRKRYSVLMMLYIGCRLGWDSGGKLCRFLVLTHEVVCKG